VTDRQAPFPPAPGLPVGETTLPLAPPSAGPRSGALPFRATPEGPAIPGAMPQPPVQPLPTAPAVAGGPWVAPATWPAAQRTSYRDSASDVPAPAYVNASQGAAAASDAAAGAASWGAKAPVAAPASAPSQASVLEPRRALQLLWYDADSAPRVRREARFRSVLEAADERPVDRDLDDPDADDSAEERRTMFEVLANGVPLDAPRVADALARAVRDDAKFAPPIVLCAGELEVHFDELETLKALVTAATPFVLPADQQLKDAVTAANKLLEIPGLSSAPALSDDLANRVRAAFAHEKRAFPADYLDARVRRVLLADRRYQRRVVLGGTHLRCLLCKGSDDAANAEPLLAYLPDAAAAKLPLFARFGARLVASAHFPEDEAETQACALRVIALARVVSVPRSS
jgi:hypothetical protein